MAKQTSKIKLIDIKKKLSRAKRRTTQTAIGKEAGFSQGHISNILHGRRPASEKDLVKIYNAIP